MNHNTLENLQTYLESILPGAIEMLREMVLMNSYTTNKDGVRDLARATAIAFAPLGFTAEFIPCTNEQFGDHLILTKPGRSDRRIGLISHLDTVFSPEEEIANDFRWRPEKHDDVTRLYGPGTVDIKGGTVVVRMMMSALREHFPELYDEVTWVFMLNAAEEHFVDDFHQMCRERMPSESTLACLVFEGGQRASDGRYKLVVARKGMARYVVQVTGRSAHAGAAHERGASAVLQLADLTQKISALTDYDRQLTFTVGVFQGGTVVNRVPHQAEAEVEFRTFDNMVFDEALISMQSLEGYSSVSSPADGFACQTEIIKTHEMRSWPPNQETEDLFAVWSKAGEAAGLTVMREERGGLSDGNPMWSHVPTLDGLGPVGGNGHCSERSADGSKDQEYSVLESFVPKALLSVLGVVELITASR